MCNDYKRPSLRHRDVSQEGRQIGPLGFCQNSNLKDEWSWGGWDVVKWKILPDWLGGDKELLRNYKDAWVIHHAPSPV